MVHIKRTIDLTGENFWHVDFQEADIMEFDYREKDFGTVTFEVWGARPLVYKGWNHDNSFLPGVPHTDDYYVSGKGRVTFHNVTGINCEFFPYSGKKACDDFCYDSFGGIVKEEWHRGVKDSISSSYVFCCPTEKPFGFSNIFIWADGPSVYEFDDKDMIFEREYLDNPQKYCYPI